MKVHAGLWLDCKNCNPDWKPKKRDRKDAKPRYSGGEVSVGIAIRRQVAAELGEEEPTAAQKSALNQKYGATDPIIDRRVTKPIWQEESVWMNKKAKYDQAVTGLVPREQTIPRRGNSSSQRRVNRSPVYNPKIQNDSSRRFPQNSNPTRTGTRQQ
jgi:hypothetical protein